MPGLAPASRRRSIGYLGVNLTLDVVSDGYAAVGLKL
jgi:hypothetical protein